MEFTQYEALRTLAHRVAVSEEQRIGLESAFLKAFGSDEEKKRFYAESESDKSARLAQEAFDAKVEAEVKRRQGSADEEAKVKAAADKAAAHTSQAAPVA